jgi:hypothetical protein
MARVEPEKCPRCGSPIQWGKPEELPAGKWKLPGVCRCPPQPPKPLPVRGLWDVD